MASNGCRKGIAGVKTRSKSARAKQKCRKQTRSSFITYPIPPYPSFDRAKAKSIKSYFILLLYCLKKPHCHLQFVLKSRRICKKLFEKSLLLKLFPLTILQFSLCKSNSSFSLFIPQNCYGE